MMTTPETPLTHAQAQTGLLGCIVGLVLTALALSLCGCATTPPPPVAPYTPPSADRTASVARAVVCGLTAVNPINYGGWPGPCPGADVDADVFALLCREQGVETRVLHNEQVTWAAWKATVRAACVGLRAGDLLILKYSGHGGQRRDTNGDESDDYDETWCFWDGEVLDDDIAGVLGKAPTGLRVFISSDSCHSGTIYRSRAIHRAVKRARRGAGPAIICFSGCSDANVSYGSASGGTLTTAEIDAWKPGQSWVEWFVGIKDRMIGSGQTPIYSESGPVDQFFRHGVALK